MQAATTGLAAVLKGAGFGSGTFSGNFSASEVTACKALQGELEVAAVAHNTFAQDQRPMPRIKSSFLNQYVQHTRYTRASLAHADIIYTTNC